MFIPRLIGWDGEVKWCGLLLGGCDGVKCKRGWYVDYDIRMWSKTSQPPLTVYETFYNSFVTEGVFNYKWNNNDKGKQSPNQTLIWCQIF